MNRSFRSLFLLLTVLLSSKEIFAQLDTVFWFAAPEITQSAPWGNFDRPLAIRVSTLGQPARVTISIPASPMITPVILNVAANSAGSVDVTSWIDLIEAKPPNTILNGGIKISATAPVNIYYEVISGQATACQCNPEIFVLKGRNALGTQFIVPSQNLLQNGSAYTPMATNSFDIIASEDNTSVTITPSAAIVGHAAGTPFSITLSKGQVISNTATSYLPAGHLTGSMVTSNKPIAITVKDDMLQGPACWDLGGDQVIPTDNLSTEYIAVRGYLSSLTDNVFVTAINNNTSVSINGAAYAVLNANQTIAVPFSTETMYISATGKVYAFQLSGFGCEIGLSTIPSIKCRGSSAVSFTRSSDADLILLITTRTGNENAFLLNGAPLSASSFSYVPATANQWMYARLTIPVGQIPALSSGRLVNSMGLFQLGIIHGSTTSGGARFGYFSDYAVAELNAFPDTTLFCGANGLLDAGSGFSNYTWNTGAATSTLAVSANGFYRVTVKDKNGCEMSDSSRVILQTPRSDSIQVNICSGERYTLPGGVSVNATGVYRDTLHYVSGCDSVHRVVALQVSTAKDLDISDAICGNLNYILPWGTVVQSSGVYRDTVRNTLGCDSIRQTVHLSMLMPAFRYVDGDLCDGKTFTLPDGNTVDKPGVYQDTLRTPAGCDSIIRRVTLIAAPVPEISLSKSNDIDCASGSARLQAAGGATYSWFPGTGLNDPSVSDPFAAPSQSTWYHVLVSSDKGCTTEDSIFVEVSSHGPPRQYAIPNAFSPNGDGKNDCFGISSWGVLQHLEFVIFNRWGQRIFSTADPSICWDGRYLGRDQPAGTYVYQIRANNACGAISRKGTITLIR